MSHRKIACFSLRHAAYNIGSRRINGKRKGHALFARLVELDKLRDIVRCDRERERLRRRHQQVDQDPDSSKTQRPSAPALQVHLEGEGRS